MKPRVVPNSSDQRLKHNPFSSLRGVVRAADPPPAARAPSPAPAAAPLGRVIVREEIEGAEHAVRVIGVSPAHHAAIAERWRDALARPVLVEGRDLLVITDEIERVAASLREAGASEVKIIRRPAPAHGSPPGQPGGTVRAEIRRGLGVAIVQKMDQDTGALTEGVVREILTSAPVHPRGIKVRLASGEVGRVRRILPG